ncbi:uncharacterized protein TNCV_4396301 [Trichonephila clavipes]|uniref:CCHC-type domain-containing protein n=1 Tax=Trichonephila clavipes TaxID=2585209 RepID=A0A8X6W5L6_TRICX|nr:uncharacterized protein TNCV_4396301 [Trichonephila clavipes]
MSPLQLCDALDSYNRNQKRERKTAQGNDKRRKQKEPKKKAAEPPPEETDNDKCRHHKEIQKRIKMTNGRLSFLEHCIKSEKEFPDLTDDDALIGYQKEHDELSSLKEHKLGGPAHQIENKIPAPHFYGRARSGNPDSPDIFQLKKCCYLVVQVDTFNRRPRVSQCYNCNLFNHSSKNCYMRTRCLKCGESHRTSDCPIREKIANPVCINCNKTGHMANWSQCEEFPKRKPKKGETVRNRNTITETNKPPNRSHQISPSQPSSRALQIKIIFPELRPPPKKPLQLMKKTMKISLGLKTRSANYEDSSSTTSFS